MKEKGEKKLNTTLEKRSEKRVESKLDAKHHKPDTDSNSLNDQNIITTLLSNYNLTPKSTEKEDLEKKDNNKPSQAEKLRAQYLEEKDIPVEEKTLQKLNQIEKVLERRIAQETVWRKIGLSFITGLTATLGATIGFTILVFGLSRLYTGFQDVPLIGDWLEQDPLVQTITDRLSDEVDTE